MCTWRARICVIIFTGILAAVISGLAFAQQSAVVKWEDVQALLDKHPAWQASNDDVAAAKTEIRFQRQYPNPEVGASYGRAKAIEGDETEIIWGIDFEIPIDKPGTYIHQARAAKAGYEIAKSEASMEKRDVVRRVKGLFYSAAIAQEHAASLERSRDQMAQLVEVAKLRVDHGEAPPLELTRLEIEFEKVEADAVESRQQANYLLRSLNLWMGGSFTENYTVAADWTALPLIPPLDETMGKLQQDHPEVIAVESRVQVAESELKVERNMLFPELKVGGFLDHELDANSYGATVALEVPVWNWNCGGIGKAKAQRSAARYRRTAALRQLRDDLQEIHSRATQSAERARRYRDIIFPKAQQTAKAHEEMYKVGETDVMDLLDARRGLVETETEMQKVFLESWLAYLELIAKTGGDDA